MPQKPTIYAADMSQPARFVRWVAELVEADVEVEDVDLMRGVQRKKDFLALNPNGSVPVLVDPTAKPRGGSAEATTAPFVLWESNAIAQYIVERHANNKTWAEALYPSDPVARAVVRQWMDWKHGKLREGFANVVRRRIFGPRVKEPHPLAVAIREVANSKVERDLMESAALLDAHLAKTKAFLVPGTTRATLADLAVFEEVEELVLLVPNDPAPRGGDLAQFPHLQAWIQRVRATPKYEEVHRNFVAMAKMLSSRASSESSPSSGGGKPSASAHRPNQGKSKL